ncbi:MAG: ABC transporter permease [Candidatus Altiarchaeota archaeon]
MFYDYLKLGIGNITHRKLRSWLTMIGIFVGIMTVVALISLGQGLQNSIDREFEKVGGDRIMVTPGGGGLGMTSNPGMSDFTAAKLRESDLDVIRNVRGVDQAIGILVQSGQVKLRRETKYAQVYGIDTDVETLGFLKQFDYFIVDQGRYFRDSDRYKAIVGVDTGDSLFDRDLNVGDKIWIEDIEFDIVGINKKAGNPAHDQKIVIPLETAKEVFGKTDEFAMISVKTAKGFEPANVAEEIKKKLRRHRDVKEDEEDFSVETAEAAIEAFKTVLNIVQSFLVGIAAISLIVGGIGIMTTMYTSVTERTKQIGIMKAIGARNSDIMRIFLIESGLLGMVGGIIGVVFGLMLSKGVEQLAHYYDIELFTAWISWELIVGALTFSFIIGCVSGVFPARKAARMNPVDALRFR